MVLDRSFQTRIFTALKNLILVLTWLLASQAMATGAGRPEVGLRERPDLRFGVLAFRPKPETLKRWQPIADYLAQQIPTHRVVLEAFDYPELEQAVREQRVDLVLTQPAHYVALSVQQNLYSPLATLVESEQGHALTSFGGVIVVKSQNENIRSLSDLKSKQIAASSRESLGGYLAQAFELSNVGIHIDDFDLVTTVQQDAAIHAVLLGRADAGFVRSGLIEQMALEGKISLADLKVIKTGETPAYPLSLSTRLYPQWALAAMPWLTPSVSRQIASAVLAMPQDGEVAKAAQISGFTIPGDYRSVDRLMRVLRIAPFDERVPLVVIWEDHRWLVVLTAVVVSLLTLWLIGFLIRNHRQRQRAEARLRQAASVFQHASEGITITDPQGTILDVNEGFTRISGYQRDDVIGKNPRLLRSGRQGPEFYTAMWNALLSTDQWRGEIWNRRKNGEVYAQLLTISTVRDERGKIQHYIGLSYDITALKEQQQHLEHMAHYDSLTRLPNRVLLADRLDQALSRSKRTQSQIAVAYIDLDGFKTINDSYGHEVGDKLLIQLANRMKQALRDGDTLSRLGGDEFVAVLPDLQSSDVSVPVLERLLATAAQAVHIGECELRVSASIGVTYYPQTEEIDADQLLRQSDQAMYQAKVAGKNRYHIFDAVHDRAIRGRLESIERVRDALEHGEFVLHYQPKVNMRIGQVIGAEALIRWQHPERGLLSPAAFLPIIEDDDVITAVGDWVLDTALTQMEIWQAQGVAMALSVNVASRQLQQPDFVDRLKYVLARHPTVNPVRLELEVLETSALADLAHVSQVIQDCAHIGVKFALDDFGTGYSSLAYLKHLRASQIKIDQSFVRDMLNDPDDLAILQGVIGLATAFKLEVIAEGVETVTHGTLLLQMGCELAQGYGIARPMPAEQLPIWAATWQPDAAWSALESADSKP
jgi:diguanylate cyclase (GGDEF)-like protein/PAS domain S-box-containing protein